MIVKAFDREYYCTKAVRGANFIRLYYEKKSIASFSEISDFSPYEIYGGTWSDEEPSTQARLEAVELALLALLTTGKEGEDVSLS